MRVELRGITKTFPGVVANNSVDFIVETGEVHALLGENGAGKSTLMNVLYGLLQRDAGTIAVDGATVEIRKPSDAIALGIGMVHQDFLLIPRMTVLDNVLVGVRSGPGAGHYGALDRDDAREQLRALSSEYGLGVNPDSRVADLSVGEQQRVEILKLLFREARLLILDEPTSVLGPVESAGLFEVISRVRDHGGSIVLITHKLKEVLTHTDNVTVMRAGRNVATRRTSSATTRELAELMVGESVPDQLRSERTAPPEERPAVRVDHIDLTDAAGVARLTDVSLEVKRGEIFGIAGVNGNGQSELAEVIVGLRRQTGGHIQLDGNAIDRHSVSMRRHAGVRYVPADRRGVGSIEALSITENIILGSCGRFSRHGFVLRRDASEKAEEFIARYEVLTPSTDFPAGNLSGGNLQKLILARELEGGAQLLVVEQPTRGLDVKATARVRQTLLDCRDAGIGVLLISVDLDELLELSDRIGIMFDGRLIAVVPNDDVDVRDLGLLMAGVES